MTHEQRDSEAKAIEQAFMIEEAGKAARAKAMTDRIATAQLLLAARDALVGMREDMAGIKVLVIAQEHEIESLQREQEALVSAMHRETGLLPTIHRDGSITFEQR